MSSPRLLLPAVLLPFFFPCEARSEKPATLPGYVLHFDAISGLDEGRTLVRLARRAGAKAVSIVPPARVWDRPDALEILDGLIEEAGRNKLGVVLARMDASYPPDAQGKRVNALYGSILKAPGLFPDGRPVPGTYTTVGHAAYEAWMEEETRYHARRYGKREFVLGITLGPLSDPLGSARGSLLAWDEEAGLYEIAQYTPEAIGPWRRWMREHIGEYGSVSLAFKTVYKSVEEIPIPGNPKDGRFGEPARAYSGWVRMLGEWVWNRYEACRQIWKEETGGLGGPFILQLSGFDAERIEKGRPAYQAFDLKSWTEHADALGLSLHSTARSPDLGHESMRALIQLAALARARGKPVFVLESGVRVPPGSLDTREMEFSLEAARPLEPRTFFYEYLKALPGRREEEGFGYVVRSDGKVREPVLKELRKLFDRF